MTKVAIIDGGSNYHRMFLSRGFRVVYDEQEADLICFTGGADVSPSMYGEKPHPYTRFTTTRDKVEQSIFESQRGKKFVGICRGAQFLNVMMGGGMWQDVDNHAQAGTHELVDLPTGEVVQVSSTHHQMMRPADNARIVATASLSTYYEHMVGDEVVRIKPEPNSDVEIVAYGNEVLCFQPHPEFYGVDECRNYFFELIKRELEV